MNTSRLPFSVHIPSVIIPYLSIQMLFLCIKRSKGRGRLLIVKEHKQSIWKTWWCGEIRQRPTYIGCTTSDTKRRTDSSRLNTYFTGHTTSPTHRTCTPAKGMPISVAIAPAVPQKNPTPAKSTASPPAKTYPNCRDGQFLQIRTPFQLFPV